MSLAIWGCLVLCIAAGLSLLLGAGPGWWVSRQERRRNERARKRAWRE